MWVKARRDTAPYNPRRNLPYALKPQSNPSFHALVDAGEPFRLLFPVGALLGLIGVLLWPAFVWWGLPYPLQAHVGLVVQGFLASFIFGFLGTAVPRMIEVPHFGFRWSSALAAALCGIALLHLLGFHLPADLSFVLLLCVFFGELARRARRRRDLPPPGFVLVLLGVLCALTGSVLQVLGALVAGQLPATALLFGKRLLQQGFLLLPIMGVGAFLLPRFFQLTSRHRFPESTTPTPGWTALAAFAGACGLAVVLSFFLEALGWWRTAFTLRAAAFLLFFCKELPIRNLARIRGGLAWSLLMALASIPAGYLAMALYPQWQQTLIHLTFISGFSLLTLTVAARVVLGHSGQEEKFHRPLKPIIAMALLMLLAMATRLSADWMPQIRFTHYGYAAFTWALAVIIWAVAILPGILKPDRN